MANESGHESGRAYIGQDGHFYLNGAQFFDAGGDDVTGALGPAFPFASPYGYYDTRSSFPFSSFGTVVLALGGVYMMPIYVPNPITARALGCEITTGGATGTVALLGLYSDAVAFVGHTLLGSTELFVTTGTGGIEQELTTPLSLDPGLYWMAILPVHDDTYTSGDGATYRSLSGALITPPGGYSWVDDVGMSPAGVGAVGATADELPATISLNRSGSVETPRLVLGT